MDNDWKAIGALLAVLAIAAIVIGGIQTHNANEKKEARSNCVTQLLLRGAQYEKAEAACEALNK